MAAMSLPEFDVARIEMYCNARVPPYARDQVRVEAQVAPTHVTIVERRAPWDAHPTAEWTTFPIARLRYVATEQRWHLYWRDRHQRFHAYDHRRSPSRNVQDLLDYLDSGTDPIFWG